MYLILDADTMAQVVAKTIHDEADLRLIRTFSTVLYAANFGKVGRPTLEKLEGHIAFGLSVCVCVCVHASVTFFKLLNAAC